MLSSAGARVISLFSDVTSVWGCCCSALSISYKASLQTACMKLGETLPYYSSTRTTAPAIHPDAQGRWSSGSPCSRSFRCPSKVSPKNKTVSTWVWEVASYAAQETRASFRLRNDTNSIQNRTSSGVSNEPPSQKITALVEYISSSFHSQKPSSWSLS